MPRKCHKHEASALPRHQRESPGINNDKTNATYEKKVREKSRECHNHKPQPFPDPERKSETTDAQQRQTATEELPWTPEIL